MGVLVITGTDETTMLNTCCTVPSVFEAVMVTGPKVPVDTGVPLRIFPFRLSQEGLPVTEISAAGVPDATTE